VGTVVVWAPETLGTPRINPAAPPPSSPAVSAIEVSSFFLAMQCFSFVGDALKMPSEPGTGLWGALESATD
jgi:hypothetical protein